MTEPSAERQRQRAPLTVAVVGPGAIGTTIAAALQDAELSPVLCGRSPRDALSLRSDGGVTVVRGPILTDPELVHKPVDLVFLAVKTTQVEGAAHWLRVLCGPDTVVCVLQNGVEQVSQITPLASGATVIPAVVWFPAETQPDGSVWLRGHARITLPRSRQAGIVADALRGRRCTVELADNFADLAWRKLLQNALAGLMVLTRQRAGMYRRPDITQLALQYLDEGLLVARAEGANLGDGIPHEILSTFHHFPPDMGSSILADREAGRPLEWAVRNGIILRRGQAHGIATPISEVLVPLLAAASDGPPPHS